MYKFAAAIARIILFSPLYILVLWGVYLLIDYAWGGLGKVLRLLLFPGYLFRIAVRVVFLSLIGADLYIIYRQYGLLGIERVSLFTYVKRRKWAVLIVVLLNAIMGLLIGYGLIIVVSSLEEAIGTLVVSWLAISFIIESLPSTVDFHLFYITILAQDPLGTLLSTWVIVIFVLSYLCFGALEAIMISIAYLIFLIATSPFVKREDVKREEAEGEPIIVEDEE
ncbi:MAG: hypothetical protein ACTSUJ_06920 [Candidatus Njordarchaeales archaeon]